jgi:hypothetical protein
MAFPTAASAHYTQIEYNGNYAYVNAEHDEIWVYDGNCNGHNAYAILEGSFGVRSITDSNGCQAGYPNYSIFGTLTRYRLCETDVGCTGWKSP